MTKTELIRFYSKAIAEGVMPGMDSGGGCSYRTRDGRKCAVGVLLDDATYDEFIAAGGMNCDGLSELTSWRLSILSRALDIAVEGVTGESFWIDIQNAHDSATVYTSSENSFRELFFFRLRDLDAFVDVPDDVWQEVMQ